MSVFTNLKLAMRALWRNKVRSMLTMLGIVFGIGAVIAMVAVGQGAQQSVKEVFDNLGTNVLSLTNGSQRSFGAAGGAGSRQSLTWDDIKALESGEIQSIKWVAPMLQTRTQVASEDANWNTSVIGTTAIWFQVRNWAAVQGAVFDEDSGNGNAKIAVIGKTVANQLYGTANPIGQVIRISGQPYEVMAILQGLVAQGKTVILVTHESDIAAYASRVVTLRDGLIIDDKAQTPVKAEVAA